MIRSYRDWLVDWKSEGSHVEGYCGAAFSEFKLLAEQGNASAQFSLGAAYDNGLGVVQDYKEAVKWYRKGVYPSYTYLCVKVLVFY
jgi:TPR repeat protein